MSTTEDLSKPAPRRPAKPRQRHLETETAPVRVIPKVTTPAPDFAGTAVINNEFVELSLADFKGKYLVFLFYPANFTEVTPSELIAFSKRIHEFRALNVDVLACAPDSQFGHQAFVNASKAQGGLGSLAFPLLADFNRSICRDYNVLVEADGVALRALFLIDGKGIVRHVSINDLSVGRNVEETLRIIKAIQFYETHGDVCPANWKPGDDGISPRDKANYFNKKYAS